MVWIYYGVAVCAMGVSCSVSMLGALILFVGSFAFITAILLLQGELLLGVSYTVVYIGAITVIFVFAVLVIDSYQEGEDPKGLKEYWGLAIAIGLLVGGYAGDKTPLFDTQNINTSLQKQDLAFLSNLIFNEAGEILLPLGLVLLFSIIGPVLVWV